MNSKYIQISVREYGCGVKEIIGDHQYGFPRNRSTMDQIFYTLQILETNTNGSTMGRYISCL
jgi:hypothetical protein